MTRGRLILCLAGAIAGCHRRAPEAPAGPIPPQGQVWLTPQQVKDAQLTVETVGVHTVGQAIVSAGKVTFDDLLVSHVFSPVTGRITRILAQPGQRVKKGAPLCAIASPDLGQAASDVAKAQAAQFQTEKDFKRSQDLYEANAVAQRDFEASQAAYLAAKAELERARRKLLLLKKTGGDEVTQEFTLVSQIDGEVIMRAANPGVEVQGMYSGGTPVELFTIGSLERVWILADVFEVDLARVRKGAAVSATLVSQPGRVFEGKVEWVSGALDPVSRTAKVRCSIDNKDLALKPEMYTSVRISVDEEKALAIPKSAPLRMGDQIFAFVEIGERDGLVRFERRPIAVDLDKGTDWVAVAHGLDQGERVVTTGGILLMGML